MSEVPLLPMRLRERIFLSFSYGTRVAVMNIFLVPRARSRSNAVPARTRSDSADAFGDIRK